MEEYQKRVIDEAEELDIKIGKLEKFFNTPMCEKVDAEELARLDEQLSHMNQYSRVLGERIAAFK